MRFELIIVTVKQELTDQVVDTAREKGATGATIIPARGIGSRDQKTFFGLTIEGPVDVVLFLVEEHATDTILKSLAETCKIDEPGAGLALVVPVSEAVGISSQMQKFRDQARDQYF